MVGYFVDAGLVVVVYIVGWQWSQRNCLLSAIHSEPVIVSGSEASFCFCFLFSSWNVFLSWSREAHPTCETETRQEFTAWITLTLLQWLKERP